ncbi:MAG: hypothetical protein HPY45_09905 [Anaerolineae bacterium]|nr:hypothetical protein [Anaerolineae bacterium]
MYQAILNAIIPAEPPCTLHIERADWAEVERALAAGTPHYVRHPGTTKLLGCEPNSGFYSPRVGDQYLVLRLRSGIAPRGAEVEAKVEDLEILKVTVE